MSRAVEHSWTIRNAMQVVVIFVHILACQQEGKHDTRAEYEMRFLHSRREVYELELDFRTSRCGFAAGCEIPSRINADNETVSNQRR